MVRLSLLYQVPEPRDYVPLINCLMSSSDPPSAAAACIASLGTQSVTAKEVADCAGSELGSSLLHNVGLKTKNLQPPLTFVPWLLYNDVTWPGLLATMWHCVMFHVSCFRSTPTSPWSRE